MRVWYIHPGFLDGKRLVAAHREIHMLLTCVKRKREWGPTRHLKFSMPYCQLVHDETINEMDLRRQLKGDERKEYARDFIINSLESIHSSIEFTPNNDHFTIDVQQLRGKWEAEEYYYGTGRHDLRSLERLLGLVEGVSPSEALLRHNHTRSVLKRYKTWFDNYRQANIKSRMQDRIEAFKIQFPKVFERKDSNCSL